jgi:hypothetical protein
MATPLFSPLQETALSIRKQAQKIIVLTMQVVEKMANFDGIRSTYHTFSYLIYLHMALDQCQWFGYD